MSFVLSCSNTDTVSIRDDPYRTSRKNILKLIELFSVNKGVIIFQSCYKAPPGNEPSEDDELEKLQAEPAIKCCCISWAAWIDKICIIIFPTMYLTFHIVYWKYYTNAANK
jgi:hypothetical protein